MNTFIIGGRCIAAPPPAGWREQLAQMLGAKPRRIGTWAEMGLYGALSCMADAGETKLVPEAQIWLGSRRGTYAATAIVLEQLRDDLPMPLVFLQTQPSQMLALLAARLDWNGHACFIAGAEPRALLRLAAAQAGEGGMLLGWVDEMDGGSTNWLRLRPASAAGDEYAPVAAEAMFSPQLTHLRIEAKGLRARHAGQASLGESGAG